MEQLYNYYPSSTNETDWNVAGRDVNNSKSEAPEAKKSVYVKWEGKTISLGTFPATEAARRLTRAKQITQQWRMQHASKNRPSKEWVIQQFEDMGLRQVVQTSKPKIQQDCKKKRSRDLAEINDNLTSDIIDRHQTKRQQIIPALNPCNNVDNYVEPVLIYQSSQFDMTERDLFQNISRSNALAAASRPLFSRGISIDTTREHNQQQQTLPLHSLTPPASISIGSSVSASVLPEQEDALDDILLDVPVWSEQSINAYDCRNTDKRSLFSQVYDYKSLKDRRDRVLQELNLVEQEILRIEGTFIV